MNYKLWYQGYVSQKMQLTLAKMYNAQYENVTHCMSTYRIGRKVPPHTAHPAVHAVTKKYRGRMLRGCFQPNHLSTPLAWSLSHIAVPEAISMVAARTRLEYV